MYCIHNYAERYGGKFCALKPMACTLELQELRSPADVTMFQQISLIHYRVRDLTPSFASISSQGYLWVECFGCKSVGSATGDVHMEPESASHQDVFSGAIQNAHRHTEEAQLKATTSLPWLYMAAPCSKFVKRLGLRA